MIRVSVPERLSLPALHGFVDALEASAEVCLLVGEGSGFCQGIDLAAVDGDPEAAFALFGRALAAIRARPTIAFVDGDARGGGVGLAAACDVVLATEAATFALPEALLGLVPGAILPALLDRMSAQKVRRMALTGLSVGATEALALGLVDAIGATERDARSWARALSRAEPQAAQAIRRLCAPTFDADVAAGGAVTRERLADPVTHRRIAIFLDGGAPWSA